MAEAIVKVSMEIVVDPGLGNVRKPKYFGTHYTKFRTVDFNAGETEATIYVDATDAELSALAAEADVEVL